MADAGSQTPRRGDALPKSVGADAPRLSPAELDRRLAMESELVAVARPHLDWISATQGSTPHVACLVGRDGVILHAVGTDVETPLVEGMRLGYDWSDGAPIHGPSGDVVGAIVLATPTQERSADGRALLSHVTFAIGRELAARSALHESEARFRGAFDHAAVGMAITNRDGQWIRVNRAFASMLGYTEAELVGRPFHALTDPDDLPLTLERRRQVLAGERASYQVENRLRHKLGNPVWVLLHAALVRDDQGAPRYFVSQVIDVTERKLTEAALDVSNMHYATYVTNAPGMVYQFVYRADGGRAFTVVSEASRTLVGVAPAEILRDPEALFGLVHPEERQQFSASAAASRDALAPWSWEGRVILASGEEKRIRAASRPTPQPDGSIVCDGVLMDVTAQQQAAKRLEESEQRYRSLFDHHPDGVFSLGTDGSFLSANPACERISGFALDELIGRAFVPLIVPEQVDQVMSRFRAAVAGDAQSYETTIWHKSGRRVEIDTLNIPIVVGDRVIGVFGIVRDLSVRRALEGQLRQAQKMEAVGRLAGGVAHDFNNILAAISGFAELLTDDLPGDDPRRADLDEILKSARLGAGLTRQLLAFSRQQVLQPAALDLNLVVADTATMLRPLLGAALQLVTRPSGFPVRVMVDRSQIEQVLLNLALNARDAMPLGGTLTVVVGVTPVEPGASPRATLVVSDTGNGMAPEVAARAFEPFFTTKSTGKGTGLGLATVHGIIEQSGGTIRVETAPHEGTTFLITLPLVETSVAAQGPSASVSPSPGGGTVLLVEDEPSVRAIAHRILQRAGYRVLVARDGQEALRIMNEPDASVDLLLSDVVMPEIGGIELAAIAVARFPDLRVILMSGYADTDVGPIGHGELVERFLAKPFTAASLLQAVEGDAARREAGG